MGFRRLGSKGILARRLFLGRAEPGFVPRADIAFIGSGTPQFRTFVGGKVVAHAQLPAPAGFSHLPYAWISNEGYLYWAGGIIGGAAQQDIYRLHLDNIPAGWSYINRFASEHRGAWATAVDYGGSRPFRVHTCYGISRQGIQDDENRWHYSFANQMNASPTPLPTNITKPNGISDADAPEERGGFHVGGAHLGGWIYGVSGTAISSVAFLDAYRFPVHGMDGYIGANVGEPQSWERIADLPGNPVNGEGRYNHAYVTDGRYLYIVAGLYSRGSEATQSLRYDPKTDTWINFGQVINTGGPTLSARAAFWYKADNKILLFIDTTVWTYNIAAGTSASWVNETSLYNPDGVGLSQPQVAIAAGASAGNDETLGHFLPSQVAVGATASGGTPAGVGGTSVTVNAPTRSAGDTLFAVVTSVAGSDSAAFAGWTQIAFNSGSHRSWLLQREADGTSGDNLTFTQSVTCAIAIGMIVVSKAWALSWYYHPNDPAYYPERTGTMAFSADSASPWTLSRFVGYGPVLFLGFYSMQNNSGTTGNSTQWGASDGTLAVSGWGGRASFHGASCAILYKSGTGQAAQGTPQTLTATFDTGGSSEYGTSLRYFGATHVQA